MNHDDGSARETGRAVATSYFKLLDAGQDFFHLFADDAYVYFPKHRPARGIDEVKQLFADIVPMFSEIVHEIPYFNYVERGEHVVVEGTTHGVLADGTPWRATEGLGGRFCNVFEVRGGLIHRLHVYLDPDYADADTARYPWLARSTS
ncbi:nuclear transport factor 2 family protein [Saccharopolyspora griseoalba]|uniref:Nuclear transport factor 2 family protein n=1 Tax=Saccharopolyspora griseoalba TaxID=1431848 RepID=A0ABW2LQW9_9PSEU